MKAIQKTTYIEREDDDETIFDEIIRTAKSNQISQNLSTEWYQFIKQPTKQTVCQTLHEEHDNLVASNFTWVMIIRGWLFLVLFNMLICSNWLYTWPVPTMQKTRTLVTEWERKVTVRNSISFNFQNLRWIELCLLGILVCNNGPDRV